MKPSGQTVVGIDVGGPGKGFHTVALCNGRFEPRHFTKASNAADWCRTKAAQAIAVDAPCAWASSGSSRLAERSLSMGGKTVQCFKTPTRAAAKGRAFYGWVFNGESLYRELLGEFRLFDGTHRNGKILLETFPHAVSCALAGRVVSARAKASTRRSLLEKAHYDHSPLRNIDFVDAALCALTAERFLLGQTQQFGDCEEGFIVVPR